MTVCQFRKFKKQVSVGYEWQQGDIHWSERNSIVYPAISSLAGLVAGMFGVGGGIVKVHHPHFLYALPCFLLEDVTSLLQLPAL